ncbi:MAG: hypothetical protein RI910_664 [Verrucomicrobiota bacterium]|jgi:hypothetical protein
MREVYSQPSTQRETGDRIISWGLIMAAASYPVSGLPLALWLWPTANR